MKKVLRILLVAFLVAHAFVHLILRGAVSWLITTFGVEASLTQALGTALIVLTIVGFSIGGFLLLFSVKWWRPVTLFSAGLSLILLVIFWELSFWVAIIINVAIIGALLKVSWFKTFERA